MNLSQRLRESSLDKKQWQRLYYQNQQAYIRQRLSAQKAHRDYDNADPVKQKKFVKLLKKNAPEKAWGENSIF